MEKNTTGTILKALPEKPSKDQLLLLEKYTDQLLQAERDTIKKAEDRSLSILPACGIAITVVGYIFSGRTGASEISKIISIVTVFASIAMVGKCIFYISRAIRPIQIPQLSPGFIQGGAGLAEVDLIRDAIENKIYLQGHCQNIAMEKMLYFDRALRSFVNVFPLVCIEIFSIILNDNLKKLDAAVLAHLSACYFIFGIIGLIYIFLLNTIQETIRKLWRPKEQTLSDKISESQNYKNWFRRIYSYYYKS